MKIPLVCLLLAVLAVRGGLAGTTNAVPKLYAYCVREGDDKKRSLPEEARLLRELGYDGGGYPLWLGEELDANLKVLDEAGLPAYLFWVRVDLNKPLDPQVLSALGKLKGHPATISGNPGPRRVVNAGALHTVNLIDAILGKNKTVTTLASAIRSDISCHLVDLAIRHGGKVGWDAAANTITGNDAAKAGMSRAMRKPWDVLNPKYTS